MTQVVTTGWPHELLSLDDWESLPADESHRVECAEGVLVVIPKPLPQHQRAMVRLTDSLDRQLPADLAAVADVEVVVCQSPLTIRAPDVLVTGAAVLAANRPRLTPSEVFLAVEIVSEGSRRTDQVTKMSEYAEKGIPDYWIIEAAAPQPLSCYHLGAHGGYELVGTHSGVAAVNLRGIVIQVDLDHIARL